MKCNEAQTAIHSILDDPEDPIGELVYLHLDGCSSCEEHLGGLQLASNQLKQLEWLEAPDRIFSNVMAQITQEDLQRLNRRILHIPKWSGYTAACVVLLLAGGVYWSQPNHLSVITSSHNGNLNFTNHAVIVPTGSEYRGDLTISNGDLIVKGKVDGDVTALNGRVILASGADIKGRTQEVHAFWQWVSYYSSKLWNTIASWF